jgi:hypothetical protein
MNPGASNGPWREDQQQRDEGQGAADDRHDSNAAM